MVHVFFSIVYVLFFVGAAAVSLFIGRKAIKAWDLRYDEGDMQEAGLNDKEAEASRIAFKFMCLPLLGFAGLLYAYQAVTFTWTSYITVAALGVVTMPVRKIWGIYNFRKVYRAVYQPTELSLAYAVRRYYAESWTPSPKWQLENRLTWLNPVLRFLSVVLPYAGFAVAWAAWPVSLVWVVYYHGYALYSFDYDYTQGRGHVVNDEDQKMVQVQINQS
jgi:hypothetical protein